MRITVDLDVCEAHGECVATAPEIFDLGDGDDTVTVLEPEPGADLHEAALAAQKACPVDAITIED